jgi:hypothetical protein
MTIQYYFITGILKDIHFRLQSLSSEEKVNELIIENENKMILRKSLENEKIILENALKILKKFLLK